MANPFSEGTTSYQDFETMSDLRWHCTKCELESAQAKTWQTWRHRGIQLAQDEKGNYYKRIGCPNCEKKTVHRPLLSLEVLRDTKTRAGLSSKLANRIKDVCRSEEALLLRRMPKRQLEIEHRFPQVRWGHDEEPLDNNMADSDIRARFILLTRSNNLLKSRQCERCVASGKRGLFPGIRYWYYGDDTWDASISPDDKEGCVGCFWYDPYTWREKLNELVEQASQE